MKKTLVAIAALAAVSAFAQSTATISGVVAFGLQKAPNATATTKADTGFAMTDATIAFGLVEDLGGGLRVSGNMTFDGASSAFANALNRRNSTLALSGDFGTVRFSQTRTSDLLTGAMVAPSYLPEGLYNTSGVVARAPMDWFAYTSPSFSGFTATLGLAETATDGTASPTRRTLVLSGNYANGPLVAGLAFKNTSGVNGALDPAQKSNIELFGTYDFGMAKIGLGLDGKTNAGGGVSVDNAKKSAISFGVSAPVGPATVGLNFAKRGTAKVTELAGQYAMSKRTALNASFGNQSASAATAAVVGEVVKAKQSQFRIAMIHTF